MKKKMMLTEFVSKVIVKELLMNFGQVNFNE